ncbi:carboxypeptidase-like regulatory domain-containing protein [Sphingobacterium sp. E70]|uniref:carboxypeptidase-like regulatory domain-containing protein n=1 Tax=Sphingobacterium sp. E70 TaxID=2853439 RepID=UPI00211CD2FF|nr:carboxypeptidase-like regulatory domain-containing protein [Sphingobacterium sp. E70]ULT28119.1 carboxypeptidase-like regulatory domain-containing protein [Sphingobacterium sp. E70]
MKKNYLFYSKARPLSLLGLGLLCSSPNLIASNLNSKLSYFHVEQQQISGSVKNEKGDPLAGATITVKGSTIQAATDANGSFSIRAKQEIFWLSIIRVMRGKRSR